LGKLGNKLAIYTHLKYLSCFIFPGCVVWFLATGPHDVIGAIAWTLPLWSIIVVDWLGPKTNPELKKRIVSYWYYDTILYALAFIQFLIIALMLIYASQLLWSSSEEFFTSIVNLAVLRILVGTTSGSSAIIVAHELIHRSRLHQRFLGRLILYSVCYEHFVIAHLRGHHQSVATPEDIATARLNENFKDYWKRVTIGHFKYAWNSEMQRLEMTSAFHYKIFSNSVFQGLIVEVTLVILILFTFGWAAAFIFLYQALSGVRLLETINYYQHWGLEQGKAGNAIAWVNQSSFTEYALVGLSNHIEHHQNPGTPFYAIPFTNQGPKMPYGYFVTNLMVKLNNDSYRRVSTRVVKSYFQVET